MGLVHSPYHSIDVTDVHCRVHSFLKGGTAKFRQMYTLLLDHQYFTVFKVCKWSSASLRGIAKIQVIQSTGLV